MKKSADGSTFLLFTKTTLHGILKIIQDTFLLQVI